MSKEIIKLELLLHHTMLMIIREKKIIRENFFFFDDIEGDIEDFDFDYKKNLTNMV